MPVTFVITCRDVKGSKFTAEPGQTRYLRVPADADEIVPAHEAPSAKG